VSARHVAIGNFDGVHRGHQLVLRGAVEDARAAGLVATVLTFHPHPAAVLGRVPPPLLTRLERKRALLEALGVEVVVRTFDAAFAALEPPAFAAQILARELGARRVVVGDNFRFGKGRSGDVGALRALGATLGFDVSTHDLAGDEAGPFSSTRARDALARGDLTELERVLGRPHRLRGTVVTGDRRGRTLGFPTANLGAVAEALPLFGVYAVRSGDRAGVANIGARPTVGGTEPRVEVHFFDFEGDLYDQELDVDLLHFLRAEQRFAGLDELRAQIATDAAEARRLLSAGQAGH